MADPQVVQVMRTFKTNLLGRERRLLVEMARRWIAVERSLQIDAEKLADRMQREGITPERMKSMEFRARYLASLLAQTRAEVADYADYANDRIREGQRYAAKTGILASTSAINAVTLQKGVKASFDILPIRAVEFMVGNTGAGTPLGSLLRSSYATGFEGMIDHLITGTAKGQNPKVTARAMVRDGLSQSLNRMMLTARTEQLRVFRESSRMAYEHSGLVTNYLRSAARDQRTCIGCLAADGWEYEIEEHFKSHPSCRCALIPVVKGFARPRWETGQQWFYKQTPEVQKKMLGPARYKAYKSPAFAHGLDNFVKVTHNPVWGDGITTASLRDLGLAQEKKKIFISPGIPEEAEQPRPRPQAPIFTKKKEAEKWAEETFGVTAKFGKIDISTINATLQGILETEALIPQMRGAMNFLGSSQERNKDIKEYFTARLKAEGMKHKLPWETEADIDRQVKNRVKQYVTKFKKTVIAMSHGVSAPGTQWENFKGISINDAYADPVKINDTVTRCIDSGWFSKSSGTVRHIVDHELGHEIDKVFNLDQDPEFLQIVSKIKAFPGGVASAISQYATTNNKEIIAEAWAEYASVDRPRQAAKMVGDLIMKRSRERLQ